MFNTSHNRTATLSAAALCLAATPVLAKSGVNIGALSCTVDGGMGLILGSSKEMDCRFEPAGGSDSQDYRGTIAKLGIDIGVTGEAYMSWLVFAPGSIKPGALRGSYSGVSAQASVGLGLGANVLVGGLDKSIALQPLSIEGQTGLNLAAGLSRITLEHMR
jgi:hypothetical protein